jgi:uncharacterized protein (DUF433 family)
VAPPAPGVLRQLDLTITRAPRRLKVEQRAELIRLAWSKETIVETTTRPVIEIERNPKRCSGHPTLAGTRTTVHDIVANVRLCNGDLERMVEDFPHLTVEVIEAVLAWYRDHQEEIDGILQRRRERYERRLAQNRAAR